MVSKLQFLTPTPFIGRVSVKTRTASFVGTCTVRSNKGGGDPLSYYVCEQFTSDIYIFCRKRE